MRASKLPVRAALPPAAGATLATLTTLAIAGTLWGMGALGFQETRQEEVAQKGAQVMPFDLEQTTHVFENTGTGGVQKVVADDPSDAEQVTMIRRHLKEEAAAFQRGDLSNPSEIHGREMPGLEDLEAGVEEMDIRYSDLPGGATVEYETSDPALVAALHDWFNAQISDHGDHAEDGGSAADGLLGPEVHDDEQHHM